MVADLFSRVEPAWINAPDAESQSDVIALLSCVRVRRNIEGFPFPGKCSKSELYDAAAIALGNIGRSEVWNDCDFRMIDGMDNASRHLLLEMRLISPHLAKGGAGRFFLRDGNGVVSCMINEEDHISISVTNPGVALFSAHETAKNLEASVGIKLARDTVLGYLTANPNYVGTGTTASILLHLPALDALGEMHRVCEAFERDWRDLALYKLLSDEENISGSFYLVSNRTTLAITEQDIVSRVTDAAESLISKETFARHKIQHAKDGEINDKFWRAWGLLRHARKLSFSEAINAFSVVKLGSDLRVLPHIEEDDWRRMVIGSQRYHLSVNSQQILTQAEEPYIRATIFRQFIEQKSSSLPAGTV